MFCMKPIYHFVKHKERMCTHLVLLSRRNVPVNASQTVPKWDTSPILGQTRPKPRHYRLSANILPYFPRKLSQFGTLSPHPLQPVHILQSQAWQGISPFHPRSIKSWHNLCFIGVSSFVSAAREIDASNNPSRGGRRHHCSVIPAAPLRRGMEGGKEHPGTYYNRPFAYPWVLL